MRFFLIFLFITFQIQAQKLESRFQSHVLGPRTFGLDKITIHSLWDGKISTGHFHFQVLDSDIKIMSSEKILIPGMNRFSIILPYFSRAPKKEGLKASFISEGKQHSLGYIINKKQNYRSFVVLSNGSSLFARDVERKLSLRLISPINRGILSYVVEEKWKFFPSSPVEYCGYDMILLFEDTSLFDSKKFQYLLQWVEMGGSLLLFKSKDNTFRKQIGGKIIFQKQGFTFLRKGLGRIVLYDRYLDTPTVRKRNIIWKKASIFLWKLNTFQKKQILKKGQIDFSTEFIDCFFLPSWNYYHNRTNYYKKNDYEYIFREKNFDCDYTSRVKSFEILLFWIFPKNTSFVPLYVLIPILVLFLVAVGPFDYMILGFFRKRYLTWGLFPLLSVFCFWFMIQIVEYYMGGVSNRSISFVDFNQENKSVKRSTFSLMFSNKKRLIQLQQKNTLFGKKLENENFCVKEIHGKYPNNYQVKIMLTPYTFNTFRQTCYDNTKMFPVDVDFPKLKKVLFPDKRYYRYFQSPEKYYKNFQRYQKGSIKEICWKKFSYGSTSRREYWGNWKKKEYGKYIKCKWKGNLYLFHQFRIYTLIEEREILFPDSLLSISRRQGSIFRIVSQISPNGAGNFEDLSILDPHDPSQWLLLFVFEKNGNYYVYRKMFYSK